MSFRAALTIPQNPPVTLPKLQGAAAEIEDYGEAGSISCEVAWALYIVRGEATYQEVAKGLPI